MKTQTLASAFQAALTQSTSRGAVEAVPTEDNLLLVALKGSTTTLDEIVSRRIGLIAQASCLVAQ